MAIRTRVAVPVLFAVAASVAHAQQTTPLQPGYPLNPSAYSGIVGGRTTPAVMTDAAPTAIPTGALMMTMPSGGVVPTAYYPPQFVPVPAPAAEEVGPPGTAIPGLAVPPSPTGTQPTAAAGPTAFSPAPMSNVPTMTLSPNDPSGAGFPQGPFPGPTTQEMDPGMQPFTGAVEWPQGAGDGSCCPSCCPPGFPGGWPACGDPSGGYPSEIGDGGNFSPSYDGYPPMDQGLLMNGAPFRRRWYARAESVWLDRTNGNNRNLSVLVDFNDQANNSFVLRTNDANFNPSGGLRVTLGHYLNDCTAIEGGFYGGQRWDDRKTTTVFPTGQGGTGPLFPYWGDIGSALDTPAFFNANVQSAAFHSSFNSGELGIRRWMRPNMSVLFGFRYINLADGLDFSSSNGSDFGQYRNWTTNNLFGAQIGTEYTHPIWSRWLFGSIEAKGGGFANSTHQKNVLFNTGTLDQFDERSAGSTTFARMIDLSASLTALLGSHITLRGGYTVLFLDGVALASDQLDTSPTQANSRQFIADKGSILLHGPFAGAEVTW